MRSKWFNKFTVFFVNFGVLFEINYKSMSMRFKLFFAFMAVATFVCAQSTPELIYYRFNHAGLPTPNEAQFPVGDDSVSITGTGLSIGGAGMQGSALIGTGASSTNGIIHTNWQTDFDGSFTIGFWCSNITQGSDMNYVFGDLGANAFRCFTNGFAGSGNWMVRGGNLPDMTITGGTTSSSNYIHIVYDAVRGIYSGYLNGQLNVMVPTDTGIVVSGNGFTVGGFGTENGLSGRMDEFRVYNRALTTQEIHASYNQTLVESNCNNANAGTLIANFSSVCSGTSVNISSLGVSLADNAQYTWQESTNGTIWSSMTNDTLVPLEVTPSQNTFYRLVASCGSTSDTSDAIEIIVRSSPLSGTYTIDQNATASNTNFTSFNQLADALYCSGVGGAVNINVVANTGPYNERVDFREISGVSSTNTITIDGNGNMITYNASNQHDKATFYLFGVNHLTLRNLHIDAADPVNAFALQLRNQSDYNTFENCTFSCPDFSTSTSPHDQTACVAFAASRNTVHAAGNNGSFNTFDSVYCFGGHYGISFYGASSVSPSQNNTVINSFFDNQFFMAISVRNEVGFEIIGNEITRTHSAQSNSPQTGFNFTGIDVKGSNNKGDIRDNVIHDIYGPSTGSFYGINCMATSGGDSLSPNVISNNLIYNVGATSNSARGIAIASSISHQGYYWDVFHNTVILNKSGSPLTGPNASAHVISAVSPVKDAVKVYNNLFYIDRTDNSGFIALSSSIHHLVDFDNNVYYATPSTPLVTFSQNIPTFTDWQAQGNDANGFEADPDFDFSTTGIQQWRPQSGFIKSIGQDVLSVVPSDIEGVGRTTSPDPGVFEFTPAPCSGVFNFEIDTLSTTSATISWQGTTNAWELVWDTCGFDPGSAVGAGHPNHQTNITNSQGHTLSNLPTGECICVFIREVCVDASLSDWSPPYEICVPIETDARMVTILQPSEGQCGSVDFDVKVLIQNLGLTDITSMPIHVELDGDFNQTFNHTYTGLLQTNEIDTVTLGTIDLRFGGWLDMLAYTDLSGDMRRENDTLIMDSVLVRPLVPYIDNPYACPGTDSVFLEAQDIPYTRMAWFTSPSGGSPFAEGFDAWVQTSQSPVFAQFLDYPDSLTASLSGNVSAQGTMFDVSVHTDVIVESMDINPGATGSGIEYRIYYKQGSYSGNTGTSTSWTLLHTEVFSSVTANTPLRMTLPMPLHLDKNDLVSFYVTGVDGASVRTEHGTGEFEFDVGNNGLSIYQGVSVVYPFGNIISPRRWNGQFNYLIKPCSRLRSPVSLTPPPDRVLADFSFMSLTNNNVRFFNTSVNADSVLWDFDGLGSSVDDTVVFQFPADGNFNVCLTAFGVCGPNTRCVNVPVFQSSIGRFKEDNSLKVFPNPNQGKFRIEFNRQHEQIEMLLVKNIAGQEIWYSMEMVDELDLSFLSSGMYFLSIHTSSTTYNKKVIIKKE